MQRSSHVEARRRFLAALAMDPFNRAAFDALQNDVREVESISHTVRAGRRWPRSPSGTTGTGPAAK